MTYPLPNTTANAFIEYNDYKFNNKSKSEVFVRQNLDASGRVITSDTYNITVTSFIVPRSPVPGDTNLINRPQPFAKQFNFPGNLPYSPSATIDAEMSVITKKLNQSGKTFRYIGQGHDIYVNTIDPNTGTYVPDINYGPHVKVISCKPSGFNKCWILKWTIELTIHKCPLAIDYNQPGKRIQEYVFTVDYSQDSLGYCRRTVNGHLKIISPVYKNPTGMLGQGQTLNPDANIAGLIEDYNAAYSAYVTELQRIANNNKQIQVLMRQLDSVYKSVNTFYVPTLEEYINLDLLKSNLSRTEIGEDKITLLINLYSFIRTALINVYGDNYEISGNNLDTLRLKFLNTRRRYLSGMVTYPDANYPSTDVPYLNLPLSTAQTYGPIPGDNSGNLTLYETADQYRDIVFNSILIPFNYIRENAQFRLSADKRMLMFTITDIEQPSFSLVPGYARVKFTQDSSSESYNLSKWTSTLTGTFYFSKFIYGTNNTAIVNTKNPQVTGYSNQIALLKDNQLEKIAPRKNMAFCDFMRVVYQRFAFAFAFNGKESRRISFLVNDKPVAVNTGSIVPVRLNVTEDITGTTISYSITFIVTSTGPGDIPILIGSGLPLIIASDLNSSNASTAIDALNRLAGAETVDPTSLEANVRYAALVHYSTYSDGAVHDRWLSSQRYASNNSRGGSNLIFNRSYDKPIQICSNDNDVLKVIPVHGESVYNPFQTNIVDIGKINVDPVSGGTKSSFYKIGKFFGSAYGKIFGMAVSAISDSFYGFLNTSNTDVDLFIDHQFATGSPDDENNIYYGPFEFNNYSGNPNGIIDDSGISYFDALDTFVVDNLIDLIGVPTPERSYVFYDCAIDTYVDNQLIRHKPLAMQDFSPQTVATDETVLENNFYTILNYNHDNLVGESIDSTYYADNPPVDDIFQIVGSPSVRLVIKGEAIRAGYDINPPNLLKYGGQVVYQKERKVSRKQIGRGQVPMFYATWYIEYYVKNLPIGVTGVPQDPYLRADVVTGSEFASDNILVAYEYSDQYID